MARERYLLHQGEETIHSDKLKRTPKTFKEKRQNFWYYHKWHVVIAIAAVVVAIVLIRNVATRENTDYQVGLVTDRMGSEDTLDRLAGQLELCSPDRNGDGQVLVQVTNYAVGESDNPQITMANDTKLIGDFQVGDVMLYLCDETGYSYLEKQDGWDAGHKKMQLPASMQVNGLSLTANMRILSQNNNSHYDEQKALWDAEYTIYQNALADKQVTKPEQTKHASATAMTSQPAQS